MSKELEHIKSRLKDIERKSQSLTDQIHGLSDQKHELIRRGIELRHGIKVGSIVLYHGTEYRVVNVQTRWGIDRPWLEGNPKRKDGTFGTAHRNLYGDWTVAKQPEAEGK